MRSQQDPQCNRWMDAYRQRTSRAAITRSDSPRTRVWPFAVPQSKSAIHPPAQWTAFPPL